MTEKKFPKGVGSLREVTDHHINDFNREHVTVEVLEEEVEDKMTGGTVPIRTDKYLLSLEDDGETLEEYIIRFQKGSVQEASVNGITDEALLAVVVDRLRAFNNGPYRCRETSIAITKIEEALLWLRMRSVMRELRGVEGTSKV